MAIAGLQNVSALGPCFGESTTRTSSVLRMWRELEGDHAVSSPSYMSRQQINACNISEDANHSENHALASPETEHEDNLSVMSEQSSDLGESERERARQIFRESKTSGASNCERVILRPSSGLVTEADSQTEKVHDELITCDQQNRVRRPIRRLCGRQTLVDLLLRAQCERKGELWHLSEQKPVSEFAHRNRIQALLRGGFLINKRLVSDKRESSVAATELDFLRERQTVSDLREEFLSKLDNSASSNNAERKVDAEVHAMSDSGPVEGSYRTHHNAVLGVTLSENNEQEVPPLSQNRDHQVTELGVQSHENKEIDLEPSFSDGQVDREVSMEVESVPDGEGQILENIMSGQEASIAIEHADSRNGERMDNINILNDSALQTDHVSEARVHSANLEDIEHMDASSLLDSEMEIQGSSLQEPISIIQYTEWTDHTREGEDDFPRNWHDANQWLQETPENINAALDHDDNMVQEPHEDWQSHDLQEAIDSWLFMPSSLDVGVSLGRFHYDHFPDDETTQTMEIRELSSRRRVSTLLRSGFRESLDQVLLSHMERQVHFSSGNSEDEPTSPALIGQDEEQLNAEQSLTTSDDVEANQFDPSSVSESNRLWDDELNSEGLLHPNSHQTPMGTEWEMIVNELRADMVRLHQRMNDMQSLLGACIDMQIELQRCMRQEVSAALNRTTLTISNEDGKAAEDKAIDNKSQLEHVRKGICCICAESKINSLLYRCGHMCTCSECAVELVRDNGNCPMCRAPIVEAVQTYFIQ